MCWPWPFIWKIFLKNTILFFFTFLPLSLCSSGDHNVIFDEKEYSPLPPPPPPPKKRIKWPHTWTRLLHMDFSITWNNGRSELATLHATITQPRELMRKIPHYMSWKAIFNRVVCFGKKIRLTHEAVTIVTVLWVHKESLFTVIFRDCPAKQQLTQIDSLKVKRNFTYRRSLFFRFKFSPWTEAN